MPEPSAPTGPLIGPLIGTDRLAQWLATDDPPHLLDVRWRLVGPPGRDDYEAGHLPGAVFCDLDTVLAAPAGDGGRHPLPAPDTLQSDLRSLGLRAGRPLVVYDAADSTAAARAWWLLRWAGVTDVHVLDGGYAGWLAAGAPVTTDEPAVTPGDLTVVPGGMPTLDSDAAAKTAAAGLLLDARAAERYRGEVEPVDPVAGHIPGAVSAPTTANVDSAGAFLPAAELTERFSDLGAATGTAVGVYCGSGVTAAHQILALEIAEIPAALYPGSWSEWIRDPARPVATGDDPQ